MKHPNTLRAARLRKGLSTAQVASRIGLKREATLERWENGETVPGTPFAIKLCALYGVLVEGLYPEMYKSICKEMAPIIKETRKRIPKKK